MPALVWAALVAATAAPPPAARRLEAPQVVVLVTLDTLRADHLASYGYRRTTSPFLDTLAAGGVLFEPAFFERLAADTPQRPGSVAPEALEELRALGYIQ